ncbi:hypothetical protein [Streptomyces sp. t39]|uniref:hypothetical protein n=1 Tax=Streptomyces sp. t39 TaxID=1828156 RepID=UPI00164F8656|nr:hypothetical protein [Streptomyces sp. t39]
MDITHPDTSPSARSGVPLRESAHAIPSRASRTGTSARRPSPGPPGTATAAPRRPFTA